jgi:hypothetical protein
MTGKKIIKATKGAAAPVSLVLIDNENDSCDVMGTDAAGNLVDISSVATLVPVPTSDNTAIITVSPPNAMNFMISAVGPVGSANVVATATWTNAAANIGPFSFSLPVSVVAGGPTGITIVPGVPTVIPPPVVPPIVPPVPPVVPPATNVHVGTIISISGSAITMSHTDGTPNDTHTVAAGATITINGATALLTDLLPGDGVTITGDPATSVVATR